MKKRQKRRRRRNCISPSTANRYHTIPYHLHYHHHPSLLVGRYLLVPYHHNRTEHSLSPLVSIRQSLTVCFVVCQAAIHAKISNWNCKPFKKLSVVDIIIFAAAIQSLIYSSSYSYHDAARRTQSRTNALAIRSGVRGVLYHANHGQQLPYEYGCCTIGLHPIILYE